MSFLVDVINFEVCKHYRVFATRVYREDQLRRWMLAELARPDGGDLWSLLEDAGERRRYAVQVVVDGLQGRLVESLARGDAADPFLRAIAAEHARLHQRCVEEARADDEATWCDESQWRLLTSYTDRPDSVVQLAHLYDLDIAGTVNLFPRAGIGYNTLVPGRHAGESFHEKDAFAGAWGGPIRSGPRLRTAVIGSMPMLAYEYLAGVEVEDGDDGWGYPSLARELLSDPSAD